ncbi:thioesterase family protein [Fulvivirgaceae bacterium BMA12]|uniref:Thioesterase family protein n=1 Tax=Agaribacillus aureus TaxID=3051825 RepID=A0ABT8L6J0_9BACT|nr:thioesterase family protein [Fulvivirgaceae bacterium BMA12]
MSKIITYKGVVYNWQCDFNSHMNVQFYMAKYDEATWQFFGQLGITASYLRSSNTGMVAVEQHLKYYHELLAGDLVTIHTVLEEFKSRAIIFRHKMYNPETELLVAEGKMVGVHIDQSERKSVSMPDHILDNLKRLKEQQD